MNNEEERLIKEIEKALKKSKSWFISLALFIALLMISKKKVDKTCKKEVS
jgi:hypothetical protein